MEGLTCGNTKWSSYFGKTVWPFFLTVKKKHQPYNLAISPQGIYPIEVKVRVHRETCTGKFITTLNFVAPESLVVCLGVMLRGRRKYKKKKGNWNDRYVHVLSCVSFTGV